MSSELIENQGQQRHAINGLVVFNLNCCIFELNIVVFSLKILENQSLLWHSKLSKIVEMATILYEDFVEHSLPHGWS